MIRIGAYEFRHKWGLTVTLAILLPLGLLLGNWQLDRAEQKRGMIALYEAHAAAAVTTLNGSEQDQQAMLFRQVRVQGQYDLDRQILLENQKYNGIPGYQVFTPLRINGSANAILVNRGWVKQGDDRRFIPDLPGSPEELSLTGRVANAPSVGIKLGAAGESGPVWPKRLIYVDIDWIVKEVGYQLLPYIMMLPEGEADGLVRGRQSLQMQGAMSPQKHISYAVQWFALAGLALLMYIVLSLKKYRKESEAGVDRGE